MWPFPLHGAHLASWLAIRNDWKHQKLTWESGLLWSGPLQRWGWELTPHGSDLESGSPNQKAAAAIARISFRNGFVNLRDERAQTQDKVPAGDKSHAALYWLAWRLCCCNKKATKYCGLQTMKLLYQPMSICRPYLDLDMNKQSKKKLWHFWDNWKLEQW